MPVGLSPNTGQPSKSESVAISTRSPNLSTIRWLWRLENIGIVLAESHQPVVVSTIGKSSQRSLQSSFSSTRSIKKDSRRSELFASAETPCVNHGSSDTNQSGSGWRLSDIIVWKRKPDPKAPDRIFSARNKIRPRSPRKRRLGPAHATSPTHTMRLNFGTLRGRRRGSVPRCRRRQAGRTFSRRDKLPASLHRPNQRGRRVVSGGR